jgi:putative SOS response-associated peptidase YedK
MCGRFAFYSPSEATAALFGFSDAPDIEARYNIAPTQLIAAGRLSDKGEREVTMLRWGLIPFWAKDPSIGNRMINARAETVAEKPSFRAAYAKRRCIVFADGFYEWRQETSGKTPYFISLESGDPLAFAGLWESWNDRASGESLQTTTIITTAANEFMAAVHHRMPVVLEPAAAERWLAGDEALLTEATSAAPEYRAWPVSRRVNNAANEGADLIEPAGQALGRTLGET